MRSRALRNSPCRSSGRSSSGGTGNQEIASSSPVPGAVDVTGELAQRLEARLGELVRLRGRADGQVLQVRQAGLSLRIGLADDRGAHRALGAGRVVAQPSGSMPW